MNRHSRPDHAGSHPPGDAAYLEWRERYERERLINASSSATHDAQHDMRPPRRPRATDYREARRAPPPSHHHHQHQHHQQQPPLSPERRYDRRSPPSYPPSSYHSHHSHNHRRSSAAAALPQSDPYYADRRPRILSPDRPPAHDAYYDRRRYSSSTSRPLPPPSPLALAQSQSYPAYGPGSGNSSPERRRYDPGSRRPSLLNRHRSSHMHHHHHHKDDWQDSLGPSYPPPSSSSSAAAQPLPSAPPVIVDSRRRSYERPSLTRDNRDRYLKKTSPADTPPAMVSPIHHRRSVSPEESRHPSAERRPDDDEDFNIESALRRHRDYTAYKSEEDGEDDDDEDNDDDDDDEEDEAEEDAENEDAENDLQAASKETEAGEDEDAEPTTKEGIMARMDKLDDDIADLEKLLEKVKKRQARDQADEVQVKKEEEKQDENVPESPLQDKLKRSVTQERLHKVFLSSESAESVVERIYRENHLKAKKASKNVLAPIAVIENGEPLYYQPSDLPFFQQNLDNFQKNRKKFVAFLSNRAKENMDKTERLHQEYLEMFETWQDKVLRYEYEQLMKPRTSAAGGSGRANRTRSNQDGVGGADEYGGYMYGFPHPDEDFRYVKTLAKIPPMIMDEKIREDVTYIDNNRIYEDSLQSIRLRNHANPWTTSEKRIFLQKYAEYPKEFGRIAAFLPNKSAQDCVLFYYLNKKTMKLKSLTKQAIAMRNRRRRKAAQEAAEYESRMREYSRESSVEYDQDNRVSENDGRGSVLDSFTEDELDRLKVAIQENGKDFFKVAEVMETRTVLECRRVYKEYKKRFRVDLAKMSTANSGGSAEENTDREVADTKKTKRKQRKDVDEMGSQYGDDSRPNSPTQQNDGKNDKKEKKRTVSYWTTKEKADFLAAVKQVGRNWKVVAERVGTKTETQVRNYYQNNKYTLGLVERDTQQNNSTTSSVIASASTPAPQIQALPPPPHQHQQQLVPIAPAPYPSSQPQSANMLPPIAMLPYSNTEPAVMLPPPPPPPPTSQQPHPSTGYVPIYPQLPTPSPNATAASNSLALPPMNPSLLSMNPEKPPPTTAPMAQDAPMYRSIAPAPMSLPSMQDHPPPSSETMDNK